MYKQTDGLDAPYIDFLEHIEAADPREKLSTNDKNDGKLAKK